MKCLLSTSKQSYASVARVVCPNVSDAIAYVDGAGGVPLNAALVVVDDELDGLLVDEVIV